MRPSIVVHGGVGAPMSWAGGCRRAAKAGMKILKRGGTALEAVMAATVFFEDDGRFNAGAGSIPRMDGRTVEMDGALMCCDGRIGGVAAITYPQNPIIVARKVMDTPHILLAGRGADRFAQKLKVKKHCGVHPKARTRYEKRMQALKKKLPPRWEGQDIREIWNFPTRWTCDTVGACALDKDGFFAVANSTGGASPMLLGRIGDSPIPGAGFWAGPAGAVAATGIGEEIVRRLLCHKVYVSLSEGIDVQQACTEAVASYPDDIPIGLIALTKDGWAAADNRKMPTAFLD